MLIMGYFFYRVSSPSASAHHDWASGILMKPLSGYWRLQHGPRGLQPGLKVPQLCFWSLYRAHGTFNPLSETLLLVHYGSEQLDFGTSKFLLSHKLGSEELSEPVNDSVQRSARAKRAVRSKQISERCERMRERISEWLSAYVPVLDLFEP